MPPKRNGKGKGKKVVSRAQVEKIARQQAYAMIPKKINYTEGVDLGAGILSNNSPWLVVQPAFLDQGLDNTSRATDSVFIEKCSGFFNLSIGPTTTNRVEVRELVGFFKGSTDATEKNIADFDATTLAHALPNKMSSWDRDNFYIKHDKSYDLMPRQVYNASASGSNEPTGVWPSKRIALTQHLYRKFRYTNTQEGGAGDAVEGNYAASNHPVGWKPFIAIQVRCPDQDFTSGAGSNPGPYIDYKFKTLFKDLQ